MSWPDNKKLLLGADAIDWNSIKKKTIIYRDTWYGDNVKTNGEHPMEEWPTFHQKKKYAIDRGLN